jgi:hypothetical protein
MSFVLVGDVIRRARTLFDLRKDPRELKNVYADPAYADTVINLKEELYLRKKELKLKDEDPFVKELPKDDVDTSTRP